MFKCSTFLTVSVIFNECIKKCLKYCCRLITFSACIMEIITFIRRVCREVYIAERNFFCTGALHIRVYMFLIAKALQYPSFNVSIYIIVLTRNDTVNYRRYRLGGCRNNLFASELFVSWWLFSFQSLRTILKFLQTH